MSEILSKALILNRIKSHYKFKSDSQFAKFLDIKPQTLGNWYARNTFDPEVLYTKCVGISGDFLLSGKEPMFPQGSYALKTEVKFENKVPQVITIDSHQKDNIVLVPETLKAGYLEGYNNPEFISSLPTYRMPGLNNGVFRMFEMEGDSMFPTIPNKSFVVGQFVENWKTGIKDNQIYAVISNQVKDGLLKRCINRIEKYNNLVCKSDNRREYPTQNVDPSSIKEIWEIKLHLNFNLPDPTDIYDRMNDLEAESQQIKHILKQLAENQKLNINL